MNQKIIIGVIAVVLIAGGIYFVWNKTQTNNQKDPTLSQSQNSATANWTTYRNEQYGFEFKYPSD